VTAEPDDPDIDVGSWTWRFTDQLTLTPTMPEFAPRIRVENAASTRCAAHGAKFSREEAYIDAGGLSCVRLVCGSPEHDPDENVFGWYVVPRLV
jgi:hypothetical protein